ncbi:MAG: two-component regulator propeller domain-containing protein [Ferruginibacter sp.]
MLPGCSGSAYAQTNRYLFKHITTANGLINNNVLALCQDSKGFMWIGTQTGLPGYDGKHIVTYLAEIHF